MPQGKGGATRHRHSARRFTLCLYKYVQPLFRCDKSSMHTSGLGTFQSRSHLQCFVVVSPAVRQHEFISLGIEIRYRIKFLVYEENTMNRTANVRRANREYFASQHTCSLFVSFFSLFQNVPKYQLSIWCLL